MTFIMAAGARFFTGRRDIIDKLREAGIRPTAMMDISDGLSSELKHICQQSNVGCCIYEDKIPIDFTAAEVAEEMNLNILTCALNGGEDYELLFTIDPEAEPDLELPHTVIGMITDGPELEWDGSEKDYMGFRHF